MNSTPPPLHDAYVARYAPGLTAKYRRNNFLIAAVFASLLAVALLFSALTASEWVNYLVWIVIFGGAALASLRFARTAQRWSAEERLALAVSGAGVVLPAVGLIAWEEVTSVKIRDHSLTPRSMSLVVSALARFQGTDSTMHVGVFVSDSDAVLARMSNPAAALRMVDTDLKLTGFKGVWGQGMFDPTFQTATQVLVDEAERHGIPVEIDLPRNYQRYLPDPTS
ncbi:hypothetical protein E3T39_06130 [Cryobacterium suzukii]|uniref:Uncharacterized protein n=1 Tax=Cryobacterium suzukii TaxID=1259198 RepID=A0A4R9AH64_9MICO|nr:hypothetical protein [Cryobacterium suzukii]TFD61616.1 hypothetical protein E3T39_06130 [Cryobacterium suzukii]